MSKLNDTDHAIKRRNKMKKEIKIIDATIRYQTKSSYPYYNKISFTMEIKSNLLNQLLEEVNDYFKKQVNKDELVDWSLSELQII